MIGKVVTIQPSLQSDSHVFFFMPSMPQIVPLANGHVKGIIPMHPINLYAQLAWVCEGDNSENSSGALLFRLGCR